jgi:hypothetical protein
MTTEIPRDTAGRVLRPKPSQLLADVMDKLGPDHLTTRTLMAALIERDRGAGVEPRAVTPIYGWHIPVLSDAPNVPYDMQETSLDIEGTISRDTGWRNIGSALLNGFAPVNAVSYPFRVRRIGHQVMVRGVIKNPAAKPVSTQVATMPAGFRTLFSTYFACVSQSTLFSMNIAGATIMTDTNYPTPNNWLDVVHEFFTDDIWPDPLPGVPVTLRDAMETYPHPDDGGSQ